MEGGVDIFRMARFAKFAHFRELRGDFCDHLRFIHVRHNVHARLLERQAQLAGIRHVQVERRQLAGLREHLFGRAFARDATFIHDHNAIGRRGFFHVMGDHDNGHASVVELAAYAHEAFAAAGVEHRRGFVQNERARLHGEHAGNGDALLLAA